MSVNLEVELLVRILAGVLFGTIIGFERQWRARNAGLRTNALVALGATLFVIMGSFSFGGLNADPTRVAAQVVSGIGFLGAGVIMKQGATISGINTAATLWASAAVGALAGGGLFIVGAAGTIAIVGTNMVMRPLGRALDRTHRAVQESSDTEYTFTVECPVAAEVSVRALVFEAVSRPHFTVQSITATDLPDRPVVRIAAIVVTDERDDEEIERALASLVPEPAITAVSWKARGVEATD